MVNFCYVPRILAWGKRLGWSDIALRRHRSPDGMVYWVEAGSLDRIYLIVHFAPRLQAAVYAIPFSIFTDWYDLPEERFELHALRKPQNALPFLSRGLFSSPAGRARLQKEHPEFFGFQWAKTGGIERIPKTEPD